MMPSLVVAADLMASIHSPRSASEAADLQEGGGGVIIQKRKRYMYKAANIPDVESTMKENGCVGSDQTEMAAYCSGTTLRGVRS
jgi:hypothetical protein